MSWNLNVSQVTKPGAGWHPPDAHSGPRAGQTGSCECWGACGIQGSLTICQSEDRISLLLSTCPPPLLGHSGTAWQLVREHRGAGGSGHRKKKEVPAQAGKRLRGFLTGPHLTEKALLCSSRSQACLEGLGRGQGAQGSGPPTWNSAVQRASVLNPVSCRFGFREESVGQGVPCRGAAHPKL